MGYLLHTFGMFVGCARRRRVASDTCDVDPKDIEYSGNTEDSGKTFVLKFYFAAK